MVCIGGETGCHGGWFPNDERMLATLVGNRHQRRSCHPVAVGSGGNYGNSYGKSRIFFFSPKLAQGFLLQNPTTPQPQSPSITTTMPSRSTESRRLRKAAQPLLKLVIIRHHHLLQLLIEFLLSNACHEMTSSEREFPLHKIMLVMK